MNEKAEPSLTLPLMESRMAFSTACSPRCGADRPMTLLVLKTFFRVTGTGPRQDRPRYAHRGNFLISLSRCNRNFFIFLSSDGRHHGDRHDDRHGHRHETTTREVGTLPILRSKPTIKLSTQSFSFLLPPLNISAIFFLVESLTQYFCCRLLAPQRTAFDTASYIS